MKALVFTPTSLFRVSQFSIAPDWFDNFGIPERAPGIKRVVVNDIVYIIELELDSDAGSLVVINTTAQGGVFSNTQTRTNVFERIITTARSIYTDSVMIPAGWRRHQEGLIFSIQAPSRERNWRARLHFEIYLSENQNLFAFSRTEDIEEFASLDRHEELYRLARLCLPDAILTNVEETIEDTRAGITLSHRLPQGFIQGATLDQWYKSKLTVEQRSFVDKRHDGPVRLRGAAGTGKTLSLVIKFLRDAQSSEERSIPTKLGFLTHSSASVDLITSIGESLDTIGFFFGQGRHAKLEVRTLYDLAYRHLNFELDRLNPLSLDGREGRRLQFELITMVLKEIYQAPIAMLMYEDITPQIRERWISAVDGLDKRFIAEVMNEFASVLDAEAIRAGEERGERYAKGTTARPNWLMNLPLEIDRRFVLEVHRRYRKLLGEMNTLSVDQMVADFNSFLDSNRWDRIRNREGYDALFVDELHLFTSIERQTLHKLIRRNVEDDGRPKRPPIFMAYDLKQSPKDTFIQYLDAADHNLFSASTGLQGSELVKLDRVFRYTPQIAEFLADLDATFPAFDIPGEWDAYAGKAELDNGNTPELTLYRDESLLFSTVFKQAESIARSVDGGGRRVAVLCISEDQFDLYLRIAAGRYEGRHLPITSREPSSELRHAGKRFIVSMPEYVAGLQFDTVFLLHVDATETSTEAGDGERRRFISNVYLGSSRAEKSLFLSACLTRGGKSDILDMALARGSLREVISPPGKARPVNTGKQRK